MNIRELIKKDIDGYKMLTTSIVGSVSIILSLHFFEINKVVSGFCLMFGIILLWGLIYKLS